MSSPHALEELDGIPVLVYSDEGPPLHDYRTVTDLVGEASYLGIDWVAVPASRLGENFFDLRSGVAGEILQKFVNYRVGLAVVGDVSQYTAASNALRDLVRESNRGNQAWFVSDLDDLRERLARANTNQR